MEKKLLQPVMFRVVETKKYTTFTHQFRGDVDLARFQYWFNYFTAINQLQIYRVKGILYPKNSLERVIVQSVGGAVSYEGGSFISPLDEKVNTLVFIGNGIDNERIVSELDRYLNPSL